MLAALAASGLLATCRAFSDKHPMQMSLPQLDSPLPFRIDSPTGQKAK